jgi:hypothetical protein
VHVQLGITGVTRVLIKEMPSDWPYLLWWPALELSDGVVVGVAACYLLFVLSSVDGFPRLNVSLSPRLFFVGDPRTPCKDIVLSHFAV